MNHNARRESISIRWKSPRYARRDTLAAIWALITRRGVKAARELILDTREKPFVKSEFVNDVHAEENLSYLREPKLPKSKY